MTGHVGYASSFGYGMPNGGYGYPRYGPSYGGGIGGWMTFCNADHSYGGGYPAQM